MLRLLAEDKTPTEIGAELHISEATVRTHVREVMAHYGAHTYRAAVAQARSRGDV